MLRSSVVRKLVPLVTWCVVSPGLALAAETAFVAKVGGPDSALVRGDKTLPVRVQMPLSPADRLVAGKNSFVVVRYIIDGCVVRVASGKSLVVAQSSPCAPKAEGSVDTEVPAKPAKEAVKIVPVATDAAVARITDKSGPLTKVNFGEGLVAVKSGARLREGDMLFAGEESSITLYFESDMCEYVVEPETSLTVSSVAPCRAAEQVPDTKTIALGAAAAIAAGGVGLSAIMSESISDLQATDGTDIMAYEMGPRATD